MAVQVSQAWEDNQKAVIRKRGFVDVELGDDNTRYTSGYTVSSRIGGTSNDDYVYISNNTMGNLKSAGVIPAMVFDFPNQEETAYRTIYIELETASTKSNVNYSNQATVAATQMTEEYSDNRTIISFPIPEVCTSYKLCITKWFDDSEYVKIKSLSFGKNITIPSTRIKECTHKRSYDPMGLELPQNSIQIDIFNYDDMYTGYYEDYTNERIKINVKYGYVFDSSTEIIQGGIFYTKDIQNSDGIFSVTGDCSLTLVDDDKEYELIENSNVYSDPEATKDTVYYYDLDGDIPSINFGSILSDIESAWNIEISANDNFKSKNSYVNTVSGKRIDIIQKMINASAQKCIIDREDTVQISDVISSSATGSLLLLNSLEKPILSISKKIRNLQIKAFDLSKCTQGRTLTKKSSSSSSKISSYTISGLDFSKERIYKAQHELYNIQTITKDKKAGSYIITVTTASSRKMSLQVLDISTGSIPSIYPVNDTGEICDIENDVAAPASPEKIVSYFSNRRMYDMYVRGDPARDVGDYVMVSLTDDTDSTSFKKGLVLSSELKFDGSFKENITLRIIENEFEGTEEA